MKKTWVVFAVCALLLASLAVWVNHGGLRGGIAEVVMSVVVLVLVGFALLLGVFRLRSHRRGEPAEDELSRTVLNRAAALSYYGSLYLWLVVMYFSDRIRLPTNSLIGVGIAGMALLFLGCWVWVRFGGQRRA